MSPLELAWAAGLFEGEGSVRINKPGLRNWGTMVASVVNTDFQIVRFFQDRWPGYCRLATGLRPEQNPALVWLVAARQAAAFLEAIQPYVLSSRVQNKISVALEFQAQKRNSKHLRSDEREAYHEAQWNAYWWMGQLNSRGAQRRDLQADESAGEWAAVCPTE